MEKHNRISWLLFIFVLISLQTPVNGQVLPEAVFTAVSAANSYRQEQIRTQLIGEILSGQKGIERAINSNFRQTFQKLEEIHQQSQEILGKVDLLFSHIQNVGRVTEVNSILLPISNSIYAFLQMRGTYSDSEKQRSFKAILDKIIGSVDLLRTRGTYGDLILAEKSFFTFLAGDCGLLNENHRLVVLRNIGQIVRKLQILADFSKVKIAKNLEKLNVFLASPTIDFEIHDWGSRPDQITIDDIGGWRFGLPKVFIFNLQDFFRATAPSVEVLLNIPANTSRDAWLESHVTNPCAEALYKHQLPKTSPSLSWYKEHAWAEIVQFRLVGKRQLEGALECEKERIDQLLRDIRAEAMIFDSIAFDQEFFKALGRIIAPQL